MAKPNFIVETFEKATEAITGKKDEAPAQPDVVEEVPTDEGKKIPIYISSKGLETRKKQFQGKERKFVYGSINGRHFEVLCDKTVEVDQDIYEALKPTLSKQRGVTYTEEQGARHFDVFA